METVKLSELQSQWEAVSVDLSRLSQPLLPHLVALVQQLLEWINMRTRTTSAVSTDEEEPAGRDSDLVMHRLCAMATTALSVLMDRYPDTIIEAAHDIHTVRDIISISSRSTGLPFFPTLPKINEMWGFAQARVLERYSGEEAVVREAAGEKEGEGGEGKSKDQISDSLSAAHTSSSSTSSATSNSSSKGISAPSPSAHTECLMFDGPSRAVRRAVAEALSCELGVSSAKCLIALEFCMGDADRARMSLRRSSAAEGLGFGSSSESVPGSDSAETKEGEKDGEGVGTVVGEEVTARDGEGEATPADLDLSDEHPLRNVCESDPLGDTSRESSDLPWRSLVPNQIVLRRVALAASSAEREAEGTEREGGDEEEEAGEKSLSPSSDVAGAVAAEGSDGDKSSSSSSAKSAQGPSADIGSLITFGSCIARCEEEGATRFPVRAAMGMCMSRGVTGTHTVMATYDYSLGVPTCEVVEMSSLRAVKKYYDRPVLCMGQLARDLDLSITILRLREIACKLLAEGNLNLHKDAERPEDWVRILRLAVFSECKCSADPSDASKCKSHKRNLFIRNRVEVLRAR